MSVQGRLIRERGVSAAYGLAFDEAIAHEADEGVSPLVLRLYTFLPSVMVGRYQNLQATVRVQRCEELRIGYNRRHTGGGAVLMGADQLAVGLAVSTRHLRLPTTIRGLFELFAQAFSRGLKQIGLRAEFVGKNDIQIDGKKIAGLAISQDEKNAVFFHASVLLDFDLRLMLDVLNLPRPGSLDTSISCFGDRMATLRQYSAALSIDELEAVLLRALEETFSVGIVEDGVSEWERSTIAELMRTRYSQDEWIFFRRAPRRRCGVARRKTAGGLIEVHLALLGDAIETVLITGSFFGRIRDVSRLESVVRWQNANAEGIGAIVQQAMRESGVYRVSAEEVADVIMEAAESARNESRGKTTSSAQALA